ncbi:MAG: ABC transporter permease [Deltaproteobacteria bacterium]|nr:MAG: ABC transporter permease [Deltaproteobacteria bacterium]
MAVCAVGGLVVFLAAMAVMGLICGPSGSAGTSLKLLLGLYTPDGDAVLKTIIWQLRFPRVLAAAGAGATLALGGLTFQALLRNPLSEPYILGVSGGSAIGGIIGILMGLSRFPGTGLTAFAGSLTVLGGILVLNAGTGMIRKDALLLSGVMVNAFCSAVILFLISLTQDARLHTIMFWLMGDLSAISRPALEPYLIVILPCFCMVFYYAQPLNLLLTGPEMALSMGVNVHRTVRVLLVLTSLMVSMTVSYCGLIGFVGLVIPHILRAMLGPDHRVLVPACILGGGGYLIVCDVLARTLPGQGEMPVGVITAMIGAPVFIGLLKRRQW